MEAEGTFLQGSLRPCGRELGVCPPPTLPGEGKSQKLGVEAKQLLGGSTDLATVLSRSIVEEEQRCSEVPMPCPPAPT